MAFVAHSAWLASVLIGDRPYASRRFEQLPSGGVLLQYLPAVAQLHHPHRHRAYRLYRCFSEAGNGLVNEQAI